MESAKTKKKQKSFSKNLKFTRIKYLIKSEDNVLW